MARHITKMDEYLFRKRGLHITELKAAQGFEWMMLEYPLKKPDAIERRLALGQPAKGYGWPRMRVRWCTRHLKTDLLDKEAKRLGNGQMISHYIGIAADESERCKPDKWYPLVAWGVTEADALKICYDHGFDFGGLYKIYSRASCWCCPLQSLRELRQLRKHHPELWARLMDMDNRARTQFSTGALGQFKENWSVERLEERFAKEELER